MSQGSITDMGESDEKIFGTHFRPFKTVPIEIKTIILLLACGRYFGNPRSFIENRLLFLLVCSEWANIIIGYGPFWTSYILRPAKSKSNTIRSLSRTNGHSLDLQVELRFEYLWKVPNVDQLSLSDVILLFSQYAPGCSRLRMFTDDPFTLKRTTSSINSVNLPDLDFLSLSCIYQGRPRIIRPVQQTYDNAFITSRRCPSIIRLSGIAITWSVHGYFENVTTLLIENLWEGISSTIQDLHSILHTTRNIVRLALSKIRCMGSASNLSSISLPFLKELYLNITSHRQTVHLVAGIIAPLLTSLQIGFSDNHDLDALRSCTGLFSTVKSLLIDEGINRYPWARIVSSIMPNLTCVDLAWSTTEFFRSMMTDYALVRNIWPKLKVLILTDAQYGDVIKFLNGRGPECEKLDELRIHYTSEDEMEDDEIELLQTRVVQLNIDVDYDLPWYYNIL
ncbi:hypothetical protein B0H13DRAFT_2345110 [Mycena leptocephala]|nr:hypothetical protein B0H13DRAFT_2345110 [Mycena leptocephala]